MSLADTPPECLHASRITCPFCKHRQRDSSEWNNGEEGDGTEECGECGREFWVSRHVTVAYTTRQKR